MDKKIAIIAILVVLAVAGFFVYEFVAAPNMVNAPSNPEENANTGADTQAQTAPAENAPQVQIETNGVQVQGDSDKGFLSVCMDKCGDGVCQERDPDCEKSGNLNCSCPETKEECPKDCK